MLPYVIRRVRDKALRMFGLERPAPGVADYTLFDLAEARARSPRAGALGEMIFEHSGRPLHKWTQYLEVYEFWFARYRGTAVRMLEIGVSDGGSLDLWRRYLGADATIHGIDVNPACADRVDAPNVVHIGSQGDPAFLRGVVAGMGTPDIILDDGSHVASHQRISFETLFPLLADGGLYVIEDVHTSYWLGYQGGYRRPGTVVELIKVMIDDLHGWYHTQPTTTPARDMIGGIHIHDSIVVIEKRAKPRPGNIGLPLR